MKKMIFTNLVIAVLFLNACTTSPICVTSSVTPLEGKVITENLGKTVGKDYALSVLGLFMVGRPDLGVAINNALAKKGGDTLINVSCYETYGWFLFGSVNIVKVEGEAVRISAEETSSKGKKK